MNNSEEVALLRNPLQKILGSISLSAAVLSIANIDTFWMDFLKDSRQESHELVQTAPSTWKPTHTPDSPKAPVKEASHSSNFKPLQSDLSRSLEQDELLERNPYASLSNLDSLQTVLKMGVTKFHREAFRSSAFQEDSGYDIVSYEIEHPDGGRSQILAYLDKADPSDIRDVGSADVRVPFVVFMVARGETRNYSFYRSGVLMDQREMSVQDADDYVAGRIRNSIPFLSVAR
jgi:hypothetical protein